MTRYDLDLGKVYFACTFFVSFLANSVDWAIVFTGILPKGGRKPCAPVPVVAPAISPSRRPRPRTTPARTKTPNPLQLSWRGWNTPSENCVAKKKNELLRWRYTRPAASPSRRGFTPDPTNNDPADRRRPTPTPFGVFLLPCAANFYSPSKNRFLRISPNSSKSMRASRICAANSSGVLGES